MDSYKDLLAWATENGVKLSGVTPKALPEWAGEDILVVPVKFIRSLKSVPRPMQRKFPRNASLHGLLSTYLTLDDSHDFDVPNRACPTLESFKPDIPFLWPSELHDFLPEHAKTILHKQQWKYDRDWGMASKAYPDIDQERYLHSWWLLNTRSFYYEFPGMEKYPHDDRLSMLPVADLFNHASVGCKPTFSSKSYKLTADRDYPKGEEVRFSYGSHSNDFLLVEYGFMLDDNEWDAVYLDDVILPSLNEEQKELLKDRGFLGKYLLDPESGGCFRTQVALRMLCCTQRQWERYCDTEDESQASRTKAEALFMELLHKFSNIIAKKLKDIKRFDKNHHYQCEVLKRRWKQIEAIVAQSIQSFDT